jgi:hypothetical protein
MNNGIRSRLTNLQSNINAPLSKNNFVKDDEIEFHDGFIRPDSFSTEYVHYYTNYKIILSQTDLDDIVLQFEKTLLAGTLKQHLSAFEYLTTMLENRIESLKQRPAFELISLGVDCLPRSIPTKWGIKLPRQMGVLSSPFDLAVHPPQCVAEILETNFDDYLQLDRIEFDTKTNMCIDRERGILWNHELGHEWANEQFKAFRGRYLRRISNFRSLVMDKTPKLFVIYIPETYSINALDTVSRIARAISGFCVAPSAIACICSSSKIDPRYHKKIGTAEMVGSTLVMYHWVPLPYPWYLWFMHAHFTMDEGLAFEKGIIQCIRQTADGLLAIDN